MSVVTLSPADMLLAAMAGSMRAVENIKADRKPAHGIESSTLGDFQAHIVGAMGELALCRHLGVDWPGKGQFRRPDAGVDIQVRTSERNGSISLILHDNDPDEKVFWCVRRFENSNRFEIFKPLRAAEGKVQKHWRENVRSPAYFIPVEPD